MDVDSHRHGIVGRNGVEWDVLKIVKTVRRDLLENPDAFPH